MGKLTLADIVSEDEQDKWLNDLSYAPLGTSTIPDEKNEKHLEKFRKLQADPHYEQILELLSAYIRQYVIYPLDTMTEFWTCTCFTTDKSIVRVNMANQEVFTIQRHRIGKVKWTLNETIGNRENLEQFAEQYSCTMSQWGDGRISLYYASIQDVMQPLYDSRLGQMTRMCNHYLMQRKTTYKTFHNYALAQAVYENINQASHILFADHLLEEDLITSHEKYYAEGQTREQMTTVRQRSRALVQCVKQLHKQRYGELLCAACGFNFAATYGEIGEDYIEAHHLEPLSATDVTTTGLNDVVLVCSNCHRMLHRKNPPYTLDELKKLIQRADQHKQ